MANFGFLLFTFFVSLLVLIAECRQFRYDYKFNPDTQSWVKLHQVPATWEDARLRCFYEGGTLASPQSNKLLSTMKMMLKGTHAELTGIYTGVHAKFSKGDFYSIDGKPIDRMPVQWMPYEPDNEQNDEDCIVMHSNGTIADVNCLEVFPYICSRKGRAEVLTECGTVDKEYHLDARTGSCYKFHNIARNFTRAFMACAAEGGYLAIINSETEAQILKELFEKNQPDTLRFTSHSGIAFVGFHDWGERFVWTTIHGQSIEEAGYNKFSGGQPDGAQPGEYCGGIFRNGLLDDAWCHERMAFICEKSVDSLLDDIIE
ncbi:unnamed protein product [Leptosia nina]|uniref:C-type lectin domain-containing protein n=1 Tax=Leptosia nina TaxID=320188 RepID=A0AAV1JFT4_9NEOP